MRYIVVRQAAAYRGQVNTEADAFLIVDTDTSSVPPRVLAQTFSAAEAVLIRDALNA